MIQFIMIWMSLSFSLENIEATTQWKVIFNTLKKILYEPRTGVTLTPSRLERVELFL